VVNRGEEKVRVHMNVVPRSTKNTNGRGFDSHRGQKIFSLPRVVPRFPLLGLTPSGLLMVYYKNKPGLRRFRRYNVGNILLFFEGTSACVQLQCYEDAKLWCERGLAVSFVISCFLCARPTVIKKELLCVTCGNSILRISLRYL